MSVRGILVRLAPPAAAIGLAVGLAGCASGPAFQGRGYYGDEYLLEITGPDERQRTEKVLREAAAFCGSRNLDVVPGSIVQRGIRASLLFQCTDERAAGSGAARPAPAHGQ